MKLFYYMGPKFLTENIVKKRVKISRYGKYGTLNDPFELSPYDTSDQEIRRVHKQVIDKFAQNQGLICLSETRYSPAMWAHYTVNHTGACLEFDVTYDHIFKVNYRREKLFKKISSETFNSHINKDNIKEMLGTKSEDWAYEKEVRMHVPLDNPVVIKEGKLHFLPFQVKKDNTFKLKRVWVGYRCNIGISKLEDCLENYRYKVKVTQTRPAFKSFSVVEQRESAHWNMEPVEKEEDLPAVRALYT